MGRDEAERLARTEAIFREVNERIAETAEQLGSDEVRVVCECSDVGCNARLDTSIAEYQRVRADGTHFLVTPGHGDERIERPVRRRGRVQVVEKFERTVAELVRRLDPRTA